MPQISLTSEAEKNAKTAEELPAFRALKLTAIKEQVAQLLNLIGRHGIFDQYTDHSIDHIDGMLAILDWLIPNSTQDKMSPADWLLIVLAVYLHDLGMLVTKEEFKKRSQSAFLPFCENQLFQGEDGKDYKAKVHATYPDREDRERFLYQEFVRYHHATRIRQWVEGNASTELGVTTAAEAALQDVLAKLDPKFLADLALVCESHHSDDLGDTRKYRTSQPYGNSDSETANIQYAAVLLRTADLLNITESRTPSLVFRVINPTDPVSQDEWAKQAAVKRVRAQTKKDRHGNPDLSAQPDTVEVFAYFREPKGFFGLTRYLSYADEQLQKSADWIEASQQRDATQHSFPWRAVDDANVETEGFLPRSFAFELDQPRILDLLTGHTLYNDAGIVVRELVQNALDAVRLQETLAEDDRDWCGKIFIDWDETTRVLAVEDNGTGMTQEILERHFLRVGASRYRDPDFIKAHPGFSSISRFGIGILSCFMLADEVEVITCHPDEKEARHLSLRSLHGKYLIRLLPKDSGDKVRSLVPHGTRIELQVRPSAESIDVEAAARRWILLPGYQVLYGQNDADPVRIGYESAAQALTDLLEERGYEVLLEPGTPPSDPERQHRYARVIEKTEGNVTLAYAVGWSRYFKEWALLTLPEKSPETRQLKGYKYRQIGSCIEGILVESQSPGFLEARIVALANATGPEAPKTNVARSIIEDRPAKAEMYRKVFRIFAEHIKEEIESLYRERGFSLTWATREASYLASPLLEQQLEITQRLALLKELAEVPLALIEDRGKRVAASAVELQNRAGFWTIDSMLMRSAENLVREVGGSASVAAIIDAVGAEEFYFPDGPVVTLAEVGQLQYLCFEGKEIARIRFFRRQRRADFYWSPKNSPPRWLSMPESDSSLLMRESALRARLDEISQIPFSSILADLLKRRYEIPRLRFGRDEIEVKGVEDEVGVRYLGQVYLLPGNPLVDFFTRKILEYQESIDEEGRAELILFYLTTASAVNRVTSGTAQKIITALKKVERPAKIITEFLDCLESTPLTIFDPLAWRRQNRFI